MPDTRKENRIYLTSLILLAVFAVCFVSAMGFLNYRTTAIDLEESSAASANSTPVRFPLSSTGKGTCSTAPTRRRPKAKSPCAASWPPASSGAAFPY